MSKDKDDKSSIKKKKDPVLKPDPETLHTTDPQEEMEGPVSSVMQNIKENAEGDQSKESADKKKDKNT
jgi:hypothetical protein